MSIRDSNIVLKAVTTAIVALDTAPVPHDIEHLRRFLSENYPAHAIASYLARATMRLHPVRAAKDIYVEFGITKPRLVKSSRRGHQLTAVQASSVLALSATARVRTARVGFS